MPLGDFGLMRRRIEEAIGGRAKAMATAEQSDGRFSRSTLQRWIDGKTAPTVEELAELGKLTGHDLAFFLPVEPDAKTDFVPVRKLDVRAAAGAGAINNILPTEEKRDFPLWMLQKLTKTARGKPAKLKLFRSIGDSMEPLIRSGALLLVDESARDHRFSPKPESPWDHTDIYVFWQDEELRIKRLRNDPKGGTIAVSENLAYGPEILRKQDFKVLGRVIWWDNRL